jgi:hypothetical protein
MEVYKFILILAVYTAILLLAIFYVYPAIRKFFKHRISISIQVHAEEKKDEEIKKEVKQPEKQEEFPSVLGKSKFVLRQPLPNAATDSETENRIEKGDTFAPETEKPKDKNINYETGEGIEVVEENEEVSDVDINGEVHDLGAGNVSEEEASGIDFNNLGRTAKAVSNPEGSDNADEDLAGKVLSENKYTGLVKSMQDARPEYAKRISELMDRYDRKLMEGQNIETKVGRKKQKLYESDDFKNFNIDDIS